MTDPKHKAKELIDKFKPHTDCAGDSAMGNEAQQIQIEHAIACAIICVKEILKSDPNTPSNYATNQDGREETAREFWQSVLTELKKEEK